jgi:hypothetical protein
LVYGLIFFALNGHSETSPRLYNVVERWVTLESQVQRRNVSAKMLALRYSSQYLNKSNTKKVG